MKTPLLNQAAVRQLIKQQNRRTSADFLAALNAHVHRKIIAACTVHNGGKVTLDPSVAAHVGITST